MELNKHQIQNLPLKLEARKRRLKEARAKLEEVKAKEYKTERLRKWTISITTNRIKRLEKEIEKLAALAEKYGQPK